LTQPYNIKDSKNYSLRWSEEFILSDTMSSILKPEVLVLCEIMEIPSEEQRPLWKIAWCFLQVVAPDGSLNIDTTV
jgi:hypothetical protein